MNRIQAVDDFTTIMASVLLSSAVALCYLQDFSSRRPRTEDCDVCSYV